MSLSYDPATGTLTQTDPNGSFTSVQLPFAVHVYDDDTNTLTIVQAVGDPLVIPLGSPSNEVSLDSPAPCTLRLTYNDETCDVSLPNAIIGCSYNPATNAFTVIFCDGTSKTSAFAKASLEKTILADGTQVLCFNDGCGNSEMFNIPSIDITVDNDSFQLVGSVLTFNSTDDASFTFDVCEVVASNCNATFTSVNADGSWSFRDNAGNTFSAPPHPVPEVRAIHCIDAQGQTQVLNPDGTGLVTIPFKQIGLVSPDDSVSVVWNPALGRYEIAVESVTVPDVPKFFDKDGNELTDNAVIMQLDDFVDNGGPVPTDAKLMTVDENGNCVLYAPPEGMVIPTYLDKAGDAIESGETLMQLGDFTDTAVPLPVGSRILALNAAGDCVLYGPPMLPTVDFNDKNGDPLAPGTELMQLGDFTQADVPLPADARILALDSNGDCVLYDPATAQTYELTDKVGNPLPSGSSVLQFNDFTQTPDRLPQDALVFGVDLAGECMLFAAPEIPEFVDKAGNPIESGAELLRSNGFATTNTTLPTDAKILAFNAAGDCVLYDPPTPTVIDFRDKNGNLLPAGTVLMQLSDFTDVMTEPAAGSLLLGVDSNGDCQRYIPPTIPAPVMFVDKNGDLIPNNSQLMQLGDFIDAATTLPPSAKLLSLDADGNCTLFDPSAAVTPVVYDDKDGNPMGPGTRLMQLVDFTDTAQPLPNDAKMFALDSDGNCVLYDPQSGVTPVSFLDKEGNVLPNNTPLMQLVDFVDTGLELPDDAKILGLDADGNCRLFDPKPCPEPLELLDKNGDPLATGSQVLQPSDYPVVDLPLPDTAMVLGVDEDGNCATFDAPKGYDNSASVVVNSDPFPALTDAEFSTIDKAPDEDGMRWNPGGYLQLETPRGDPTVSAIPQMNDPFLCTNDYFEGVQAQFMWQELEPTIGNYDWQFLDDVFAEAETCGTKKRRVIVLVAPASLNRFANPGQGPVLAVPTDANPADFVNWQRTNGSWRAHLREWGTGLTSPLHDAWKDFWVAFAARYGSNELLEAVIPMAESAVGNNIESEDPTFDEDEYTQARIDMAEFVQDLLPCVPVKISLNFLGGGGQAAIDARLQSIVDWMNAAPGRGLTWPDTFSNNFGANDMPLTEAQRVVPDNPNVWGHIADSQNPSLSRYSNWPELHNAAQGPSFIPSQNDPSKKFPPSTDPDMSWRAGHLVYRCIFANEQAGITKAALQTFIDTNPVNSYDSFPTRWTELGSTPKTGRDNSFIPPTAGDGAIDLTSQVCVTPPCLPFGLTQFNAQYILDTGPIEVALAPLSEFNIELIVDGAICNSISIPVGFVGTLPAIQKTAFLANLPPEVETCVDVILRVNCEVYDASATNSITFSPTGTHSIGLI